MTPSVNDSAVASQPRPLGHITADKREIKDFPFIRKTLYAISPPSLKIFNESSREKYLWR